MNDEASTIVVDLAKDFIELVRSLDESWTRGYYRFRSEETRFGSNASYVGEAGVVLIGAIKNGSFYDSMNEKGARLLRILGKEKGVFLLSVDSKFDYGIQFEWDDLQRWEITKMNGRTGIPEGA